MALKIFRKDNFELSATFQPGAASTPIRGAPLQNSLFNETIRLLPTSFNVKERFRGEFGENANAFLEKLRDVFEAQNVPEDEKLKLAKSCLLDKARDWFRHMVRNRNFRSYEDFEAKFRSQFVAETRVDIARKLFAMQYREESDFESYVWDFEETFRKYEPMVTEDEITEQLLETVPPGYRALFLEERRYSIEEIIKRVKRCVDTGSISNQIDRKEVQTKSGGNSRPPPKCFNCGILGHIAPDCRKKNVQSNYHKVSKPPNSSVAQVTQPKSSNEPNPTPRSNKETVGIFTNDSSKSFLVNSIKIGNIVTEAIFDTGATLSTVNEEIARQLEENGFELRKGRKLSFVAMNGHTCSSFLYFNVPIEIHGFTFSHSFYVIPEAIVRVNVGCDLLEKADIKIDFKNKCLTVGLKNQEDKSSVNLEEIVKVIQVSSSEKSTILELFQNHTSLFSGKPGLTNLLEHKVDTQGHEPIFKHPYKLSLEKENIVAQQVKEMLNDKIIESSSSPWCFPLVLVPKKDKSFRFCVDFRHLNNVTKDDKFPLPTIPSLLRNLGKAKIYSALDLASGYWQVPLAPEDREKCAFIANAQLYQFRVLPFGLKNAGATFQKLMTKVLGPLIGKCCEVYLDDIIIYSSSVEEHLQHLKAVFTYLENAGLTLKPSKCKFFSEELDYLGFKVGATRLETQQEKVKAIQEFPAPKTVKELKRFLGMTGWYMTFIKDFASIAKPLYSLQGKKVKWVWSPDCQSAFQQLKDKLSNAPVLTLPNPNKPYFLYTDASDIGLGAVLHQPLDDGRLSPIAYASRVLQPAERNYSVTERECLAVVWACDKFTPFFNGQVITVITDHSALSWLQNAKELKGRLSRWAIKLQEFPLKIEHRSNSELLVADALSRHPLKSTTETEKDIDHKLYYIQVTETEEIKREQNKDKVCKQILNYLKGCNSNSNNQISEDIISKSKNLKIENELLVFQDSADSPTRILIPRSLRGKVLKEFHDIPSAGHPGIRKTYNKLSSRVYWPNMRKEVQDYVRSCEICQTRKTSQEKPSGFMQSTEVSAPGEMYGVDLMGPLPATSRGNTQLLVVCDYFSKWVEVFPLRNATSKVIAAKLFNEVFSRYGFPKNILSDNGPQFVSNIMSELCSLLQIKRKFTTPYHPQTNLTERFNKTLGNMIRCYIDKNHGTWDKYLSHFALAIRSSPSETTGFSPAKLFLGRDISLPWDQAMNCTILEKVENIKQIQEQAQLNAKVSQNRQKKYYDQKRKPQEFNVGDKVLLKSHNLSSAEDRKIKKFFPKWEGPFIISEKVTSLVYKLTDFESKDIGSYNIVNLKKFIERKDTFTNKKKSTSKMSSSNHLDQDITSSSSVPNVSNVNSTAQLSNSSLSVPCDEDSQVKVSTVPKLVSTPIVSSAPQITRSQRCPRRDYRALAGLKPKQ